MIQDERRPLLSLTKPPDGALYRVTRPLEASADNKDNGHYPHPEIRVAQLVERSKYTRRSITPFVDLLVHKETGEEFTLKQVQPGDIRELAQVQQVLASKFDREELQDPEVLDAALRGKTRFGTSAPGIDGVFTINAGRELVGVLTATYIDLPTNQDKAFLRGYCVATVNGKGIAHELHISALQGGIAAASQEGKQLRYAASEAVGSAEGPWNSLGLSRAYLIDTADSSVLREPPYFQLALDYNTDTGEIADTAGKKAEHLMIDTFGMRPTKDGLLEVAAAYQRWNSIWPQEAFSNELAYETHLDYVRSHLEEFHAYLNDSSNGDLLLLKKGQREAAVAAGATFYEHKAADHK